MTIPWFAVQKLGQKGFKRIVEKNLQDEAEVSLLMPQDLDKKHAFSECWLSGRSAFAAKGTVPEPRSESPGTTSTSGGVLCVDLELMTLPGTLRISSQKRVKKGHF